MRIDLTKIYDGADLSGATNGVVYLPVLRAAILKGVDVLTDAAQTGDAVFSLTLNGAVQAGAGVTILSGAKIGSIAGLNIVLAKGDEIVLNLASGNVSAPITLNLDVDDGQSSGGGGSDFAPVTFTAKTGLSESGNLLTKTAGTAHGNAGAYSDESIADEGVLRVIYGATGVNRYVGLSQINGGYMFSDIRYCWKFNDAGQAVPMESGTDFGSAVTIPAQGDIFTIDVIRTELNARKVVYKKNGAALYVSSVAPTSDLHAHLSMYENGAVIGKPFLLII